MSSEKFLPLQEPGCCLRHPDDCELLARGSPLLFYPVSYLPMETRLAAMRTAIAEGADPNELDKGKMFRIGRPLNYAIDNSYPGDGYLIQLKQNLPIIELLLEAGADPRMSSWRLYSRSPIEDVETWFEKYEDELLLEAGANPRMASWRPYSRSPIEDIETWFEKYEDTWPEEEKGLYEFYEKALRLMKKVAQELDKRDAAEAAKKARSEQSWLMRLKFW